MEIVIDPYVELEIARDAGQEEIKRAYFLAVRAHPPEREPEVFRRIRAAYEMINTAERRANTDLFLIQLPPPIPRRRAASLDLSFQVEDVYRVAHSLGDLGRTDFRQDYRPVEVTQ